MTVWVLDLDGVLQNPVYPHSKLFVELSLATRVEYSVLSNHYTREFNGNEAEEKYHLSLFDSEEKREMVHALWIKLHDSVLNVKEIPDGRSDIRGRGG